MRKLILNLLFTETENRILFFSLRNYRHGTDNVKTKEAIDRLENLFID